MTNPHESLIRENRPPIHMLVAELESETRALTDRVHALEELVVVLAVDWTDDALPQHLTPADVWLLRDCRGRVQ